MSLHSLDENHCDCEFIQTSVAEWPGDNFVCQLEGTNGVLDWRVEMIKKTNLYQTLSDQHSDVHLEWQSSEPSKNSWNHCQIVSGFSPIGETNGIILARLRIRENEIQNQATNEQWTSFD